MSKFEVKEEYIGKVVYLHSIGQIKITKDHGLVLSREGKFEMLQGASKHVRKLNKIKPDYSKMKVAELRELAENKEGYKSTLKKAELIELLSGTTNAE